VIVSVKMNHNEAIPIIEWEQFLAKARQAGATDEAMVSEDVDERFSEVVNGWVIEVEQTGEPVASETVTLPRQLVQNLIYIVTGVAEGDGDARMLTGPAKYTLDELNELFRTQALGPNPFKTKDDE
jgi:hypothetical protein